MAKDKIAYVCSNCGQESSKWMGKCPSCGQWNTFKEIRIAGDSGSQAAKNAGMTMRHGGAATMFGGQHSDHDAKPMKLCDISAIDEPRIDMRDEELMEEMRGDLPEGVPAVFISSVTGLHIQQLKDMLWAALQEE